MSESETPNPSKDEQLQISLELLNMEEETIDPSEHDLASIRAIEAIEAPQIASLAAQIRLADDDSGCTPKETGERDEAAVTRATDLLLRLVRISEKERLMRAEELGSLEKTIRLKKTPLNKVLEKYWPKRSAEVRKANLKQLLSKAYGDDILIDLYYRRWCAGVDPLDCEEIAKLYGKHWKHSTKGKRKGKEIDQHKQSKKVEVF